MFEWNLIIHHPLFCFGHPKLNHIIGHVHVIFFLEGFAQIFLTDKKDLGKLLQRNHLHTVLLHILLYLFEVQLVFILALGN
ncbi:hypothetical protein D3C74_444530 [compost metagenome]